MQMLIACFAMLPELLYICIVWTLNASSFTEDDPMVENVLNIC